MPRPYEQKTGPYEETRMYDEDATGGGYPAPYDQNQNQNQSARNDLGRAAQAYPYPGNGEAQYPAQGQHDRYATELRGGERSYRGHGRYTDRDREGYRESEGRDQRSRSPEHGRGPQPSRTIMLEGLPMDMTQEDITNELRNNFKVEQLEEVRLIKDKRTGLSRQFAFAQIASVDVAKAFLEKHSPSIQFLGSYGEAPGTIGNNHVMINYSRERETRDMPGKGENDWTCEVCSCNNYSHRVVCFKCHAPRIRPSATGIAIVAAQGNISAFSGFPTTGDSDVSPNNTPSQFLLFRQLDVKVDEELLAKAVTKLYRAKAISPMEEASGPPTKKHKIASTSADTNIGAKDGSLKRVLLVRDRKTDDSWKYAFAEFASVDDAVAAMAKYNASEKFTISSKPVIVSYIHAGVFVPVLQAPSEEFAKFVFSPLGNSSVKLMYWDEGAYVNELVVAKEQTAMAKMQERVAAATARAAAAGEEGLVDPAKAKKRKADKDASAPASKKVIAPHLQFWSNRHAEIHGEKPKEVVEGAFTKIGVEKDERKESVDDNAPPSQSFADMKRMCCLLCSRQFKTEAEVNKHERISQLHRDNMSKEELVATANAKLAKVGQAPQTIQAPGESDSAYRDRAKERRQAFQQPKQPAAQPHQQKKKSKSPSAETEPDKPQMSKAAAMLGKMGWTAGQGLGAEGTGRTEAITTELYAQGVGLGAVGGKVGDAVEEANRQTGGSYGDWVKNVKDKARGRFESMQ